MENEDAADVTQLLNEPATPPAPTYAPEPPRKPRRYGVFDGRTAHSKVGDDFIIINWEERFGARTRYDLAPYVRYADGANEGDGREYKAGKNDARVLCPVPHC